MTNTYAGLDRILSGTGTGAITPGCLVLEGGAFRGLYTQGFLDGMLRDGLNLSCVVGVSAGALAGINYVAGQIGRSARVNIGRRFDSRYIGLRALLHSGSPIDVGYLTEDRGIIEPLDRARFDASPQRYVAVATSMLSGEPTYFEKGKEKDILLCARASASIPYFSPAVPIDGVPYLDGACSCSIPYDWALREGYEKIVVIRTREQAFRCDPAEKESARRKYRKYPAFAERLAKSNAAYNDDCDTLERLAAEGRLLHITPSEPVSVGQIEPNRDKLLALYELGLKDYETQKAALVEYLH